MKLKDVEVQALLADTGSLSIEPNTDAADTTPKKNTLEVDTGLSVASGKTLDLRSGIDLEVYPGKTLQVDGTLTADALQNNGTTTVTSGNTLRLRGNLTNAGTLNVTSTGRIVVDGTFASSGTVALTTGAAVLAKTFAPGAAPEGWEVSAAADADGYYRLTPEGGDTPADPETYSITFNANGGKWGTDTESTIAHTDETGKVISWPEEPVKTGYYLDGWYDAPTGGNLITSDHVFTADTTIYAQWLSTAFDWKRDEDTKTLTFSGQEKIPSYVTSGGRPWYAYVDKVENVVIKDGVTSIEGSAFGACSSLTSVTIPDSVTNIGGSAFNGCSSLTSVTIPEGVTSIGDYAFERCVKLTSVTIPEGVTSIGKYAFWYCTNLTSVTIPDTVTSIGSDAFTACHSLTNIYYAGAMDQWQNITGIANAGIRSGATIHPNTPNP